MKSMVITLSLFIFAACGEQDNQPVQTLDSGPAMEADAGLAPNTCVDTPKRLIVLGDSITACYNIAGTKNSDDCAPKKFHSYLKETYASELVYENKAIPGAITTDVPSRQISKVTTGPGHAMVLIYAGGNDLQALLFKSDANALADFESVMSEVTSAWEETFAFFNDTSNFPDGTTIIINNQYNPFDDCTVAPYNVSATKFGLLYQFNDALQAIADRYSNVTLTDQYTSFLGHGHSYADTQCPKYKADSEYWMDDIIHPNIPGHNNLASQWKKTSDVLFGGCP